MNLKNTLKAIICETMPSAAVASGFISPVNMTGWVKEVSAKFPYETRKEVPLGITPLTDWLKEQGIEAGRKWIEALRTEWIMEELRIESNKM